MINYSNKLLTANNSISRHYYAATSTLENFIMQSIESPEALWRHNDGHILEHFSMPLQIRAESYAPTTAFNTTLPLVEREHG